MFNSILSSKSYFYLSCKNHVKYTLSLFYQRGDGRSGSYVMFWYQRPGIRTVGTRLHVIPASVTSNHTVYPWDSLRANGPESVGRELNWSHLCPFHG